MYSNGKELPTLFSTLMHKIKQHYLPQVVLRNACGNLCWCPEGFATSTVIECISKYQEYRCKAQHCKHLAHCIMTFEVQCHLDCNQDKTSSANQLNMIYKQAYDIKKLVSSVCFTLRLHKTIFTRLIFNLICNLHPFFHSLSLDLGFTDLVIFSQILNIQKSYIP